jgi:creatinine amidohydrolase/Fe(II)-dependent formamide hydrolase-like protein
VLPLGSFEQHGHHLPLLTDTMICTEIARRAEVVSFVREFAGWPGIRPH